MGRDNVTKIMNSLASRRAKTLAYIEDHPGETIGKALAQLAIELSVSPEKVSEYLKMWGDAGKIVVDERMQVWTVEAKKNENLTDLERKFLKGGSSTSPEGTIPIDAFVFENADT